MKTGEPDGTTVTDPTMRGEFGREDLATIEEIVANARPRLRAEITRRVCAALGWQDRMERAKLMSARVAMSARRVREDFALD